MKKSLFIIFFLAFICSTNAQWFRLGGGLGLGISRGISVRDDIVLWGYEGSGLYYSTNDGDDWLWTLQRGVFNETAFNESTFFALHGDSGVFSSTSMTSWAPTTFNQTRAGSIAVNGNNIFITAQDAGVIRSTDNGVSWFKKGLWEYRITCLGVSGDIVFAGTYDSTGLFRSTDNGESWNRIAQFALTHFDISIKGNEVHVGSSQGLWKSTDMGTTWVRTSLHFMHVFETLFYKNFLITGMANGGIWISPDGGTTWIEKNEGFPANNFYIESLAGSDRYVFVAPNQGGFWRRELDEIVGVHPVSSEVPNEYKLHQNYPNPFNPSTNIEFKIRESGFAILQIYDALGKVISTPVNENLKVGNYKITWNANPYPSGVYFYKLTSGKFTDTRKMIFLK